VSIVVILNLVLKNHPMPPIESPEARIRYDETQPVVRSFFHPSLPAPGGGVPPAPLDVAGDFLADQAGRFRLDGIELLPGEVHEGGALVTCIYRQQHNSIPVHGGWIRVAMSRENRRVLSTVNRLVYGLPSRISRDSARVGPEEALAFIRNRYGRLFEGMVTSVPGLWIYGGRPVWSVDLDAEHPGMNLEVLVDAERCGFAGVYDRRRYLASCPGLVFMPDPVTSSGNPDLRWGSPRELLDAERSTVTLENLDEPVGGRYRLSGRWVRIADREDPPTNTTTATESFDFHSDDRRFLDVMAYYYLDRLIIWIDSLGIPHLRRYADHPVTADPHGLAGRDNSHFVVPVNGSPYLAFGEGGTPDASDPGVIVHEYGHALHYFLLGRAVEAGPNEEGFNDFLSCVFRDRFNAGGFDRANPFPWDNNRTDGWDAHRRCDSNLRFDDAGFDRFGIYQKGAVWASTLWDIYLETGGKSDDPEERLGAASSFVATYLDMLVAVGETEPLADLVEGLVISDRARTGGRWGAIIRQTFGKRGFLPPDEVQDTTDEGQRMNRVAGDIKIDRIFI
jgi:hypothetical protein